MESKCTVRWTGEQWFDKATSFYTETVKSLFSFTPDYIIVNFWLIHLLITSWSQLGINVGSAAERDSCHQVCIESLLQWELELDSLHHIFHICRSDPKSDMHTTLGTISSSWYQYNMSHSGWGDDKSWPGSMTFGSFTGFSMSEGMQRCHCNLSASCLWHSSLLRSLLKHRTTLCPLWWCRGVEKMGLCFWLGRQPNNNCCPKERNSC